MEQGSEAHSCWRLDPDQAFSVAYFPIHALSSPLRVAVIPCMDASRRGSFLAASVQLTTPLAIVRPASYPTCVDYTILGHLMLAKFPRYTYAYSCDLS